jgi:hypothetical protein
LQLDGAYFVRAFIGCIYFNQLLIGELRKFYFFPFIFSILNNVPYSASAEKTTCAILLQLRLGELIGQTLGRELPAVNQPPRPQLIRSVSWQ